MNHWPNQTSKTNQKPWKASCSRFRKQHSLIKPCKRWYRQPLTTRKKSMKILLPSQLRKTLGGALLNLLSEIRCSLSKRAVSRKFSSRKTRSWNSRCKSTTCSRRCCSWRKSWPCRGTRSQQKQTKMRCSSSKKWKSYNKTGNGWVRSKEPCVKFKFKKAVGRAKPSSRNKAPTAGDTATQGLSSACRSSAAMTRLTSTTGARSCSVTNQRRATRWVSHSAWAKTWSRAGKPRRGAPQASRMLSCNWKACTKWSNSTRRSQRSSSKTRSSRTSSSFPWTAKTWSTWSRSLI